MSSQVGKRRRPRPLVPGRRAEIAGAEYAELLDARDALQSAKLRLRRVTARLGLAIGDAEFATVDGVPVIWREQARTGGRYIPVSYRDDLRLIGRSPVGEARTVGPPPAAVLRADPDPRDYDFIGGWRPGLEDQ